MTEGEYLEWLARERRIRLRILSQSPEITASGLYRVCHACAEVLLCHEKVCPNCGGDRLVQASLSREELGGRVRLKWRWQTLDKGQP